MRAWLEMGGRAVRVVVAIWGLALTECALVGCGDGYESVDVPQVRSLYDSVPEAMQSAFPRLCAQYRAKLSARDVIGALPTGRIDFNGVELPGNSRISFQYRLQGRGPADLVPVKIRLVGRSSKGQMEALEEEASLSIAAAGWSSFEHSFSLSDSIDSLSVSFDTVHQDRPSSVRLFIARPKAHYLRPVQVAASHGGDKRRQILLVTVDTVRADYLGCYGNQEVRTPALDRLAKDSTVFDRAFSVTNMTNPSHTSIFTSLYLKDHNIVDNYKLLAETTPTMMDRFRREGLITAAFVASWNFSPNRSDVKARFDDYYPCFGYYERRAVDVNADILPWLNDHHDQDFFAWAHYFDPHMPYNPPPPFDAMYSESGEEKIELPLDYLGPEEWFAQSDRAEHYRNLYKGEISYLDQQLGDLFDQLRALRIYDEMTIVVVADHGESLGENGIYCEHRGLFDATTRVPLIIKLPGGASGSVKARVEEMVSTVDILPTLFDGWGWTPSFPIRGRSLRPLMAAGGIAGEVWGRDWVFAEHNDRQQVSVRTREHRFLLGLEDSVLFPNFAIKKGLEELYGVPLSATAPIDHRGQPNRIEDEPDVANRLRKAMISFMEDRMDLNAGEIQDEETIQNLKKLGYAEPRKPDSE